MNIIFFGSPSYSCNVLKTLLTSQHNIAAVVTQNTKNKRDKRTPVSIYSEANNLDTLYPEDLKSKDFLKKISDYKPDLFIVYAYGKILPQILLDIPEFGAVNIHCSLKNAKKLAIYLCFIRQKSRDRDYTHEIGS